MQEAYCLPHNTYMLCCSSWGYPPSRSQVRTRGGTFIPGQDNGVPPFPGQDGGYPPSWVRTRGFPLPRSGWGGTLMQSQQGGYPNPFPIWVRHPVLMGCTPISWMGYPSVSLMRVPPCQEEGWGTPSPIIWMGYLPPPPSW